MTLRNDISRTMITASLILINVASPLNKLFLAEVMSEFSGSQKLVSGVFQ